MIFDEELDTRLLRERRFRMVEEQLRLRSIHDKRVLESIKRVPRHLFVKEGYEDVAYGDHPIPLSKAQSINNPYMIGLMMQALEVRPQHKVLVVGTGSGFQTALIGEVATQVYTTECDDDLLKEAKDKFKEYGYSNIKCSSPKKVIGWSTNAPYDRILVTGALPCIPKELVKQLTPRGILVAPLAKTKVRQHIVKVYPEEGGYSKKTLHELPCAGHIEGHATTPIEFQYEYSLLRK